MIFPRANRVEHQLPYLEGVDTQVLASPEHGARFVEHELLVKPSGGTLRPRDEEFEQFIFVLEGGLDLELEGKNHKMVEGGYCWLPPNRAYQFKNTGDALSRAIWIRRRYEEVDGIAIPDPIIANENGATPNAL
jgi:(S)-ureidoglycine aminohydrolase